MVQLPYLQAFVDINKRTSRLAANISLIKSNLVPLSFIDVSESVYIDGLIVYTNTPESNYCAMYSSGPMSGHAADTKRCVIRSRSRIDFASGTATRSSKSWVRLFAAV